MVVTEKSVRALAKARQAGLGDWEIPHPEESPDLPQLVSMSQAADILGFTSETAIVGLYEQGQLPGQHIGHTVVFREVTVKAIPRG